MSYYDGKALSLLAKASKERLTMEHDLGRIRYTVLQSDAAKKVDWVELGVAKAED